MGVARFLIIEDSQDDTDLLVLHLQRSGFEVLHTRVDTVETMRAALFDQAWDAIISDYHMPKLTGLAALQLYRESGLDIPFIIVSGKIGEDVAVEAMRAGAHDYVLKGNLSRLGPAIEREMRETTNRRAKARALHIEQDRNNLRNAVAAMEQVLGVVGHELRTPLAAVRAMTELLLGDELQAHPGKAKHFLNSIHSETLRMGGMVNDLLEVARLNSGTARWNWSHFRLERVCEEALVSIRPLIDEQKVHLSLEMADVDLMMRGDSDAVRRLVLNLVNNAVKFTQFGSIVVSVVEIHKADGKWIEIEVKDSGAGIEPERMEKLGKAYALNSGVVGENHGKGSGLGLAICRGIAGAHGGRISLSSARGKGTTVKVQLRPDLEGPVQESKEGQIIRAIAV